MRVDNETLALVWFISCGGVENLGGDVMSLDDLTQIISANPHCWRRSLIDFYRHTLTEMGYDVTQN